MEKGQREGSEYATLVGHVCAQNAELCNPCAAQNRRQSMPAFVQDDVQGGEDQNTGKQG